jgi:hypothetical protein
MRLTGCLLVETALALTLLATSVWGGVRAAGEVRAAIVAHRARPMAPASPRALHARQELSGESASDVAGESTGTFLGMSDEILLERLGTQAVTRLKLNKGGSSLSFRVDFADGSRAAWKPAQTNAQTVPRKEVAAYRLNRLLGLTAVPPAVQRAISRNDLFGRLHPDSVAALPRIRAETIIGPNGLVSGAASYWIPIIKDCPFDSPAGRAIVGGWLTQGQPIPFEQRALAVQWARLVVFDFLIANPDRYSGGNMKTSADGAVLFFMDNTMSFFLDAEGPEKNRQALYRTQRFSRALDQALSRVNLPNLRRLLHEADGSEILTDAEMRAVVQRREFLERYVADLSKQYGEQSVLFFP